MTKIKNTKKGMAKKTLSISLAVAMLATSNVPVWAAEFTDGTDAAFTSEAPVVEDIVENVPEAKVTGDAWTVSTPDMPSEVEWGSSKSINVTVKDIDGNENKTKLKYVWKDMATGLAVNSEVGTIKNSATISTPNTTSKDINKSYALFIYDETGDWTYTSAPVLVGKKDVSDDYTIFVEDRGYTGKETVQDAVLTKKIGTGIEDVDFDIDYTGDLVNVGTVHVTATPIDTTLYKGVVENNFNITQVNVSADLVSASMKTKEVVYTGKTIELEKSDVAVVDKNTGAGLDGLVANVVTKAKDVADGNTASVNLEVLTSDGNFVKGSKTTVDVTDTFKVVARDLSTVNVSFKSAAKKPDGTSYVAKDFDNNNVTFTDSTGKSLELMEDVEIIVPENVKDFGTYTLGVKAAKDNKNVIGETTGSFSIYSKSIENATFENVTYLNEAEEFTGDQVTKDVEKLGRVKLDGKEVDKADYRIEFGTNMNAGTDKGVIYIVGQRTYEGSKAVIKFDINKAVVKTSDVTTNEYVSYDKEAKSPADYASKIGLVVKAHNAAKPAKEFTLVEGTDYTVDYSYTDGNKPYSNVKATVKVKADSNFKFENEKTEIEKIIKITDNVITDADIHMNKTSYEYTGAVIVPDFDVVVNGKTLIKDKDYKIVNIEDSAKVGTATLYITGVKGNGFDDRINAKATFEVTPANAEKLDVKVAGTYTYNGTAHKPEIGKLTIELAKNNVKSQFDIAAYGENTNAGEGTIVLVPKKGNKNFVEGTSKTVTFKIEKANLNGNIKVYNEKGIEITNNLPEFDYDGTAKKFAKVVFNTTDKNVTVNDYEISYINNVTGGGNDGAAIVVIAKGNYKGTNTLVDNTTGAPVEVKDVAVYKNFKINSKEYFTAKEVTVSDAEYAGPSMMTKPEIVVRNGSKVLVEGVDYDVILKDGNKEVTGVVADPSEEEYTWEVKGKGLYADVVKPSTDKDHGKNYASGTWKVVKKDLKNLDVKAEINEKGEVVLTVMNGNLKVDTNNFTTTVSEDKKTVTVAATKGNKYYVGSTIIDLSGDKTVGAATIVNVKVNGNKATVVLADDVDNAVGYDYVIATENDYKNGRVDIVKNQIKTNGTFTYVQEGTYYAYCHAWRRDENNKKVFGEWSNIFKFEVESTTPDTPVITSVKRSGRNVTVTYKNAKNAEGYDIVLGSKRMRVNGELRPVEYGKLVQKNRTTTTVTFKNVPNGKYYVGMHAYNRTPDGGNKVFSRWANWNSSVTVK